LEDAVTQAAEVGTEPGAGHPASRRDRLRAATTEEIIQTARRLLVASGPDAVTLRAIAREMGMTAPGLYRYFDNRDELVRHICASIFTELGSDIGQAIQGAAAAAGLADTGLADTGLADTGLADTGLADTGRPDQVTTLTLKMVAACQEFRRWSLNHRAEFSLLFGVPLPGLDDGRYDVADECALAFAGTFFALFLELWTTVPFPVPAAADIDSGLRDQLVRYRDALGTDIPVGAVLTFLRCWMVLYGAVAMEVFGHIRFALEDPAPMFELTLGDLAALVGLRYPRPA
jgi:AcrR family transcriptional regulator